MLFNRGRLIILSWPPVTSRVLFYPVGDCTAKFTTCFYDANP